MSAFKKCGKCGFIWEDRTRFLADPSVEIIGYQANFDELTAGLFLFNHSCGTTLAITAGTFRSLYNGPVFSGRKTGTKECPGHCINREELSPCPVKCECAYVREMIRIIKNWQKE